jgi:hypothetical protein
MSDQAMEAVGNALPQIMITVNARGEIKGDTAHIAPEMFAQMQTPESKEKFRKMYKDANGTGKRELRKDLARPLVEDPRDFRHLCPPGMSNKEFSKIRRIYFRKMKKAALKAQRSNHGQPTGN